MPRDVLRRCVRSRSSPPDALSPSLGSWIALAITHFTPQLISRGDGRRAVQSAAYRHCARSVPARVRDAIERNDLPTALNVAFVDWLVKPQTDALNAAIRARFGKPAQRGKRRQGQAASGFGQPQPVSLRPTGRSWRRPGRRSVQPGRWRTQDRNVTTLKKASALRQTQRLGQALK